MKKVVLILSFSLLASPLMGVDDKDLRHLHHTAESAMNQSDFQTAKDAYQKLLEKVIHPSPFSRKYRVDWVTYVDLVTRLAHVHLALNEYAEGEKLLQNLLEKRPPEEFTAPIKLLQSRLLCSKRTPGEAYLLMKEVSSKNAIESWRGEERSLFKSLEYMLNSHYDALSQKAKRFFAVGNYAEAKQMYEELLTAIEKGYYPKANCSDSILKKRVRFHLAEVNFYLADYEKTLALITPSDSIEDVIDRQMLYLAAMAYQEKHSYEKALDYFSYYLRSGNKEDLIHYDHALFEMGLAFYHIGNYSQARRYFEMLQQVKEKKDKPIQLGNLYLAKIYLKEKKPRAAETILSSLADSLNTHNPLLYEIAYLRGKAAFDTEEYAAASEFFELSFPAPPFCGEWYQDALFHLGWCYLKLGDDLLKSKKAKEMFFSKAESIFRRLMATKDHEKASLALGKLLLLKNDHFKEIPSLIQLENHLSKEMPSFSLEGKVQALLLRAEAKTGYKDREALYYEATSSKFQNTPSYGEAWYYRGLNALQEGIKSKTKDFTLFENAISFFEKAFTFIEKKDQRKAIQLLKWEAQANFYKKAPQAALNVFEKLIKEFPVSLQEKEEILYLRGLIASHLSDDEAFAIAKSSLNLVYSLFPEGHYADDALYVMGTLHFQRREFEEAKECFLKLTHHYPLSMWAGEGWFWAGEAAEKLGEEAQAFRKKVFENYPSSLHADESYFRFFSLEAYLNGEKTAHSHLQGLSIAFPKSALRIASYYLLGLKANTFEKGKEYFEAAIEAFNEKFAERNDVFLSYIYFRYRSQLELALLHLSRASPSDIASAFSLLHDLLKDFETPDHLLASRLFDKSRYPSLFEEGEFALARACIIAKKHHVAQEVFSKMLSHYANAGIREGYYLSRVWQEQGSLAFLCEDFDTALSCFKMAEECGKNYLSEEQKLTIWISESECYREKKEFDSAMRMLSQVINEDVASTLRIKAMLMRAEIYELQERYELAIRQLEATAKKGGEWALQAKEKLRSRYGFE